jgi:hypothetical protein
LGVISATPGALDLMYARRIDARDVVKKHADGDLSQARDVSDIFRARHQNASVSIFNINDVQLWIVTDWDEDNTCIMLPDELGC